jgi:hypothetical protein
MGLFGGKETTDNSSPNNLKVTDSGEVAEVYKIKDRLDSDEQVHVVAKQSRLVPGGSMITTPNIIFATDKRLIIRNPTMLGLRENFEDYSYDKITNIKLEKGMMSSTLIITAPGMGTASRQGRSTGLIPWGRGEDGMIDAIPKDKAEQILKLVRFKMEEIRKSKNQPTQIVQSLSIADEISKLAKLLADGLISPEEFSEMKKDLISKK